MNKKIITGVIISVFILLSIPCVSAVESNTVLESKSFNFLENEQLKFNSLKDNLFNSSLPLILAIFVGAVTAILSTVLTAYLIYVYITGIKGDPTPEMEFIVNENERALIVTSVNRENVLWSDIQILGCCDTSGLGVNITAGDIIKDCHGPINMTYLPTSTLLGSWEFN